MGLAIAIGSNLDDVVPARKQGAIVVSVSLGLNALKPPMACPMASFSYSDCHRGLETKLMALMGRRMLKCDILMLQ